MAINILVVDREFKAQFANGEFFTLNTLDVADHLIGSVGEKMRVNYLIDISWIAEATPTDVWRASTFTNPFTGIGLVTKLVRSSGNFINDGFSDGDSVAFLAEDGTGPVAGSATIGTVSQSTIVFTTNILVGVGDYGESVFDGSTQTSFLLQGTERLTALLFKPNLVENSESVNFESKVDGTEQSFYIDDIGLGGPPPASRSTAYSVGETSEIYKGWVTGSCKCRYLEDPTANTQRFEIEYEFTILPFAKVDDEQTVFELTESQNSLKLVFEAEFRTVLSDANSSKPVSDSIKSGSVATFGENFNGQNPQFSITSTTITNATGDTIDALEVTGVNTVTVVVASANAAFVTADHYLLFHSYLPTADVYVQNTNVFEDVWLYENSRQLIDAAPTSNTILTNIQAVLDSASQITLTFNVTYSAAQQALLSSNDEFLLWLQVGDNSKLTNVSDKLKLEIARAQYTKDNDVAGLMSVTQLGFFDHPTDYAAGTGYTEIIGAVEDGILVESDFTLDLALGAFLKTLNINFVAYNPTTEDLFILQENAVDITSQVANVPEGIYFVQEIDIDTTRGFTLADGDQFNFFKLTTSPLSGSNKPYNLQFGVKADWRKWLPLPDADPVFYDNTEQLNGLNKLISNYTGNGYEIRVFVNADVRSGTDITEYNFASPELKIFNYDLSLALDWVCTIETFNLAGTSLGGNISTTEQTRIKVTYDSPSITVVDTGLYWGIIRIEPQNNPSLPTIEPLSTLRSGVKDILIPLSGETTTKKSIESGNLVLECLVDFNKLVPDTNYKPSSRFGLNDSAGGTPTKLKEDGTGKDKEDGDNKAKDP